MQTQIELIFLNKLFRTTNEKYAVMKLAISRSSMEMSKFLKKKRKKGIWNKMEPKKRYNANITKEMKCFECKHFSLEWGCTQTVLFITIHMVCAVILLEAN